MSRWLIKAAVQGAISLTPMKHQLNTLLQRRVSRSYDLTEAVFSEKLAAAQQHYCNAAEFVGGPVDRARALEIGTGWHPVVPVSLAACGWHVTTIDISPLMTLETLSAVVDRFVAAEDAGTLPNLLPGVSPDGVARLRSAQQFIRGSGTHTLALNTAADILGITVVVGDVGEISLAPVDLVVSNNTFEHIPPDLLLTLLQTCRAHLAAGGVMSHFIDLRDHYSYVDASVSPLNYLRFSSGRWRWLNNSLHYQNRLRPSAYLALHEAAGLRVVDSRPELAPLSELARVPVAPEFQGFAPEELRTLSLWVVSTHQP